MSKSNSSNTLKLTATEAALIRELRKVGDNTDRDVLDHLKRGYWGRQHAFVRTRELKRIAPDCELVDNLAQTVKRLVEEMALSADFVNKEMERLSKAGRRLDQQEDADHEFNADVAETCVNAGPLRLTKQ